MASTKTPTEHGVVSPTFCPPRRSPPAPSTQVVPLAAVGAARPALPLPTGPRKIPRIGAESGALRSRLVWHTPADKLSSLEAIAVSGFANGTVTDVDLILTDLTHASPNDIDVLLSASDGRQALVLSDVDNRMGAGVANLDLTLDDEATASLPAKDQGDELKSGTYRPTDHADNADAFEPPAPEPNGSVALSAFDGANPNGTWHVWVMDNVGGGSGEIRGGWSLQITAEVDVQVNVKPKKHKKGNGRHKRG